MFNKVFKEERNGQTWYNLRHIQLIMGALSIPLILLLTLFVSWVLGAFILIWVLIGILQIQRLYINRGMDYAPNV